MAAIYTYHVDAVNMICVNTMRDDAAMSEMADRLKQARKKAGFSSARSAAIRHNWTPSTYAAHENGQNEFDHDVAAKYGRAFKVSAGWLLTGEGSESSMPAIVNSYDPDAPEEAEFDPTAAPSREAFPEGSMVELVAQGGMGSGQVISVSYHRKGEEITAQDEIKADYWHFPSEFVRGVLGATPDRMVVVSCIGDSMEPTLMSGERVWVNTMHQRPTPDGIYAIRDPLDAVVIKRLELIAGAPPRVRIISDNSKHTPQEMALDDIAIIGKVVCGLRMF